MQKPDPCAKPPADMKVKHFYIRVNEEHIQHDEDTLNGFMATVKVHHTAQQLVATAQTNFWSIMVFYSDSPLDNEHLSKAEDKQPPFDPSTLTAEERNRYEALRIWRADEAAKDNYPNYFIASNAQLGAVAKLAPETTDDLYSVKGFKEKKVAKYGDDIIAVLNSI